MEVIDRIKRDSPDLYHLLKMMAWYAGYKLKDCIDGNNWRYDLGWAEKDERNFKRYAVTYLGDYWRPESEWSMFNLSYGFRIFVDKNPQSVLKQFALWVLTLYRKLFRHKRKIY